MNFETQVKLAVYETTAETTRVPDAARVARIVGAKVADVLEAFTALAAQRLLVLEPDDPGSIRMAPPFSGVPTEFRTEVGLKTYDANSIWDAFGVAAALGENAVVQTIDDHTREPLAVQIRRAAAMSFPGGCVGHFAVPAALWWDDIVFTGSTMLLFRSEETVNLWCEARSIPRRPLLSLAQLWHLAAAWYESRLTVESRRPATDEIAGIFASIGLDDPFWDPRAR